MATVSRTVRPSSVGTSTLRLLPAELTGQRRKLNCGPAERTLRHSWTPPAEGSRWFVVLTRRFPSRAGLYGTNKAHLALYCRKRASDLEIRGERGGMGSAG